LISVNIFEYEAKKRRSMMMLLWNGSEPCGDRRAVSRRSPRVWKACGQARRAGAPWGPVESLWTGWQGALSSLPAGARSAVHRLSTGTGAVHRLSMPEHGARQWGGAPCCWDCVLSASWLDVKFQKRDGLFPPKRLQKHLRCL